MSSALALIREISLRHWLAVPLRSLLVVLGIALGVAMYIATEMTSATMLEAFAEAVQRVAGKADLIIEAPPGVPNEKVAEVAETEGVEHAAAQLEITAEAPELGESLLVLGVDLLGDLHFLPFVVTSGESNVVENPLAFVNDPQAILISPELARRHGLKPGGRLKLGTSTGSTEFTIKGVLEDSGMARAFRGQVAVMFLDAAQVAFARGTFADRIDVAIAPGARADEVAARIQKKLGDQYSVRPPEQLGVRLRVLSEPLRGGLYLAGFVALLVGVFIIYNAVGIAVSHRRKEIAILRALGVTRRRVVALFCAEAVLLSLPGIALGLVLARFLSRLTARDAMDVVERTVASLPSVEPELSPALLLKGLVAGVAMALVAAFLPARQAASTDPATGLRSSGVVTSSSVVPFRRMALVGAVLIGLSWFTGERGDRMWSAAGLLLNVSGAALLTPAVVMLLKRALLRPLERLLGIPARLALDYVERTLGRSAINVLALMVTVAMSVSVGGYLASVEKSIVDWFDQVVASDLTVTRGSPLIDRRHLRMDDGIVEKTAQAEGVARLQPIRIVDGVIRGYQLSIVATDTRAFLEVAEARGKSWQIIQGKTPVLPDELASAPLIVLSENAARRLGAEPGDKLSMATPRAPLELTVRAVMVDYVSEKGTGYIDRKLFIEHWGDESIDALNVYIAAGADADKVAGDIRNRLGGGQALFITKAASLRNQMVAWLSQAFAYSRSVELVTLIIALLGVAGTMIAAVLDRVREIGMIRAIGARRRQILAAIVLESGFLGFCAVVAGIGTGVLQCLLFLDTVMFKNTGWHLSFAFPVASTARIAILVLLAAAIAGLMPGQRAASLEVSRALGYE